MGYKSPYLTGNVHLNLIMLALHDLLNTPLYENSKQFINIGLICSHYQRKPILMFLVT